MGSKALVFLGLFVAMVLLISSEVAARELAETTDAVDATHEMEATEVRDEKVEEDMEAIVGDMEVAVADMEVAEEDIEVDMMAVAAMAAAAEDILCFASAAAMRDNP
ncbi:uncharacterized protein LOC142550839 [Primulina tabacum]|uniref:uncharacterized protein LOC142550839 n=1 Tax=Primulina tabacum TaxID=48773 RepID=UPI003F59688D